MSVDWSLILLAVCGFTALLVGLVGREPAEDETPRRWPAVVCRWLPPLVLLVYGLVEAWRVALDLNPHLIPAGRDAAEYLTYLAWLQEPDPGLPVGFRYPLAPWLACTAHQLLGISPVRALIGLSICWQGLLPVASYALGRQLMPRWAAFGAAACVVHLPFLATTTSYPWDYPLLALLSTALTAVVLAAVRTGRLRWFVLGGPLLALQFSGSARGMILGLIALAFLLAALPWARRRSVRIGLLALGAPVLLAWGTFQFAPPLYTLEHSVSVVDADHAKALGCEDPLLETRGGPDSVGTSEIPDETRSLHGSWVFGELSSLWGLPGTIAFLAEPPACQPPLAERLDALGVGLLRDLGMENSWPLLLALLVVLAPLRASSAGRQLGARALLALTLVLLLAPAARLAYVSRYMVPALALAPTLCVAGALALLRWLPRLRRRDLSLLWLPIAVAGLALLVWPGTQLGTLRTPGWQEGYTSLGFDPPEDPAAAILQPEDAVIDLSLGRFTGSWYAGSCDVVRARFGPGNRLPMTVPGSSHPARYVILWGIEHGYYSLVRQELEGSGRFEAVREDVYLDLQPDRELVLLAQHAGRAPHEISGLPDPAPGPVTPEDAPGPSTPTPGGAR